MAKRWTKQWRVRYVPNHPQGPAGEWMVGGTFNDLDEAEKFFSTAESSPYLEDILLEERECTPWRKVRGSE